MKHHAAQFDLLADQPFNLAGEVQREPEARATAKADQDQAGLFTPATCGQPEGGHQ